MSKHSEETDDTLAQQVTDMSLGSEVNEKMNIPIDANTKSEKQKIDVLLKATGNAPIMRKKKWAVDAEKQIGWISEFIRKYLKLEPADQLFLYVNQTFAPSPDQMIRNLYDCYGADGRLVLHYCITQAWG